MSRKKKRDATEPKILKALRAIGASVSLLESDCEGGIPDALIGFRRETFLLEFKSEGGRLSKKQEHWHRLWNGRPVAVVETLEEALIVIGADSGDL